MTFPMYPSIALLKRCPELFSVKEVVATEKIHGSSARLFFPAGMASLDEVKYGSRETESTDPAFPLNNMVEWFKARPELLNSMWETLKSYGFSNVTVFGEAFGPGVHAKGVKYSDGQEILFRAFDIMVEESFLTYDLFCEVASKMGIPKVPEVWRGDPTLEAFDALLGKPSVVAQDHGITDEKNLAEGVVIRSNPLLRNVFGDWLIVKHKHGKFSEVAHAASVPKERGVTPADTFAATYVTEGRLTNAIGRLTDRGVVLKGSMADMPTVLTEMVADLLKECTPEMTEAGVDPKDLKGAVSKVLGPLYKANLKF